MFSIFELFVWIWIQIIWFKADSSSSLGLNTSCISSIVLLKFNGHSKCSRSSEVLKTWLAFRILKQDLQSALLLQVNLASICFVLDKIETFFLFFLKLDALAQVALKEKTLGLKNWIFFIGRISELEPNWNLAENCFEWKLFNENRLTLLNCQGWTSPESFLEHQLVFFCTHSF